LDKPHDLIRFIEDRPGHDRRYAIDPTKCETELGWKPQVNWTDGLAATIDWYRENQQWVEHIRSGEYQKYYDGLYACTP
jgi:dTDP-glucose 4,6-dehydratase